MLGGIAASLLAAWLVASHVPAPYTGPSRGAPPKIEGARLQTEAHEDLQAFLREKNARLHGSGRVDDKHVHIPIERAMRMLAEKH